MRSIFYTIGKYKINRCAIQGKYLMIESSILDKSGFPSVVGWQPLIRISVNTNRISASDQKEATGKLRGNITVSYAGLNMSA